MIKAWKAIALVVLSVAIGTALVFTVESIPKVELGMITQEELR